MLGDRAEAKVGYTVRFRLVRDQLRLVHDRFGTTGYWSAVRDNVGAALAVALAQPDVTLDSLYPGQRQKLEQQLKQRLAETLAADGMELAGFSLGAVDLGRAGETVQATLRARLGLAREEANAALQRLRVQHDAELTSRLAEVGETALRYREAEMWRDLAFRSDGVGVSVPCRPRPWPKRRPNRRRATAGRLVSDGRPSRLADRASKCGGGAARHRDGGYGLVRRAVAALEW